MWDPDRSTQPEELVYDKEEWRGMMEERMNRKDVDFSSVAEHARRERAYWAKASIEEKLETITYLRECFYGPEATTGRLQRFFSFVKRP